MWQDNWATRCRTVREISRLLCLEGRVYNKCVGEAEGVSDLVVYA